jgi:hypothetical protein
MQKGELIELFQSEPDYTKVHELKQKSENRDQSDIKLRANKIK